MSERHTRPRGAAQRFGPKTPSPNSLRRSQRKSGSDLPSILPEIWQKTPRAAPVRKPIVLKKIVAHTVEIPTVHSPRRSPRIAFFLEKENNPPKEATKEDLFKTNSVPLTPTTTPVLSSLNIKSISKEGELDARDVEMSKKVRRSYSRLQTISSDSTSTPAHGSCSGFKGSEELSRVSPVVGSKPVEVPKVLAKPLAPDTTLPGISPPVVKEKRKKKKAPEILFSRFIGRAYSEQDLKPVVQPVEQNPEEPQVSRKSNTEPPSPAQKSDLHLEPTVTFLFTLLNTPEPKDPESDSEIQESRFLDQEDWGPHRTSEEMRHLQNDCVRLREALSTTQRENLALREKLQNLPTSLYQSLKEEVLALQEETKVTQEKAPAGHVPSVLFQKPQGALDGPEAPRSDTSWGSLH
ncbi:sororin isoform X2 [Castor canadensis]|uniref:Sororin isoform X2 n=1 Tax=Castor canadensis TaxID=51338 RepID=A0AC58KJJ9_CASCN